MNRFSAVIILTACLVFPVAGQDVGDDFVLEELLLRFTETYGGVRDANRLVSLRVEGVQIQGGEEYAIHIHRKRPASIRYRMERENASLTTVYNGERGWLQTVQGGNSKVVELTGSELDVLKREARFESPLYRHTDKTENEISLVGRERIGTVQAYVLRLVEQGGATSLYYLHPQDSHLLRVDRLDDEGKVVFQTLYRDYREVDGYPFAHQIESRIDGETVSLTRLDSIQVNPGILSIYFDKPN